MNTGKIYRTKQKMSILQCIKDHADSYVTIQQIADDLRDSGTGVGLTTIYRNLDRLVVEHQIAKVSIEGVKGNCYRYLPKERVLFYMKCGQCGALVPIDCPQLARLYTHIAEEHHIWINPGKTMFYGTCATCSK